MRSKTGSRSQGKACATARSSIVLRFLAGCLPEEMGMFIDLLLEPVIHYGQGMVTDCRTQQQRATWFFQVAPKANMKLLYNGF